MVCVCVVVCVVGPVVVFVDAVVGAVATTNVQISNQFSVR